MTAQVVHEVLPIRYCHGCDKYDNHPRVHHVMDFGNPAHDKIYHYDCVPEAVRPDHPELSIGYEATDKGLRGQDVRDYVAARAAEIIEAPADPIQLGAFISGMAPGVSLEGLPAPLAEYIRDVHGKLVNHVNEKGE